MMDSLTVLAVLELLAIGLGAGFLGGLAGVGGSMLVLPALGLILGYADPKGTQHLYMAAAMVTNFVVAVPASIRHRRSGAVRGDLVRWLVPVTTLALMTGVLISNVLSGWVLVLALAGFQLTYCGHALWLVYRQVPDYAKEQEQATPGRLAAGSTIAGVIAGMLGLGGGVIQVPLLQLMCKVPLRQAIATSSVVMVVTALFGAILKLSTLSTHSQDWTDALVLAACMAPGAVAGALLGARATHTLPLTAVRIMIVSLMLLAAGALIVRAGQSAGWW
jgi:hypothetical protein